MPLRRPPASPAPLAFVVAVAAVLTTWPAPRAAACTSIVVTRGASVDGSTMVTYAADSHTLYGALATLPPGVHAPGAVRAIVDWDSGTTLGAIPEAARTYGVVGHINEHQVVIAETTFGGREELVDPTGGIDYGSLMFVALQRARTAREAIDVITGLVAAHGYASEGETFSIADATESWLLELIGKGPGVKGAVWVALRVPDGFVTAHANQARIGQFPLADPQNCRYAPDVISFARARGYFTGSDAQFRFNAAYAPSTYEDRRACELRVWNVFRRVAPGQALSADELLAGKTPLPLWVKPERPLAVRDVMSLMRDHFEGTPFDLSQGLGAGPFGLPYRWRPLTFHAAGNDYVHDRAVSTQQTGFSFVSQARAGLPAAIGGLLWFGVDDTASTVYLPIYSGILAAPRPLAVETATFARFSWDSAFWVFNFVAQLAYLRYRDVSVDVRAVQGELEGEFLARQAAVEEAALKQHAMAPQLAREFLTRYGAEAAERVLARWKALGEALLVKYLDGNVRDEHGGVTHPGYPDEWLARLAAADGPKYRSQRLPGEPEPIEPVRVRGYFHDRTELGEWAAAVPADFPFDTEKLLLVDGSDRCRRPPRCCVAPKTDAGHPERLVLELPELPADPCGLPAHLVRLPRGESRPLVQPRAAH